MTRQTLDVASLLIESGQRTDLGKAFFAGPTGALYRIPSDPIGTSPVPARISVHIAGYCNFDLGSGGWAAMALETDPYGTLAAPLQLWKGAEVGPITETRLEAFALCQVLTAGSHSVRPSVAYSFGTRLHDVRRQ